MKHIILASEQLEGWPLAFALVGGALVGCLALYIICKYG